MVDFLTSITFGLDSDVAISEIAKKVSDEGIAQIVNIPQYQYPDGTNNKQIVLRNIESVNEIFLQKGIPLKVLPGQEIAIFEEMLEVLEDKEELLTINHSKYVLIALPKTEIPPYTDQLFFDLLIKGYTPVIAKPELNAEIADNPKKLYRLIRNGAVAQLSSGSIVGFHGKKAKKLSLQFLEYGLAHLIASYSLNEVGPISTWKNVSTTIEEKFGEIISNSIFENSNLLVSNMPLSIQPPERIPQQKFMGIF